jgi:hypothetical protein
MVRKQKKAALYEVINKTRLKSGYDRSLESLHPEKGVYDDQVGMPYGITEWPRKPRILQFNSGRIEISVSYPLAITIFLGLVLLLLLVFRIGQGIGNIKAAGSVEGVSSGTEQQISESSVNEAAQSSTKKVTSADATSGGAVKSKGNNRIVIQTLETRSPLVPVKSYFAKFGIETEIRKINNRYFLVTKNKYENVDTKGTQGQLAKQKIRELGANYKSPPGYGSFGPKPFHDAYGMKFDD